MRSFVRFGMLALACFALPSLAQQPPSGGTVVSSEPGKYAQAEIVKASAVVTAIDASTRTVTLKGPKGRSVDMVAGDEVKNFAQIKVNDEVVVEYLRALTLELKSGGGIREGSGRTDAVVAKPGAKPAGVVRRQVKVVADVIDVNPAASTITLKGPKGNVVELDVKNPDHFKVVKQGDQVEAVYTEALALSVVPVAKK